MPTTYNAFTDFFTIEAAVLLSLGVGWFLWSLHLQFGRLESLFKTLAWIGGVSYLLFFLATFAKPFISLVWFRAARDAFWVCSSLAVLSIFFEMRGFSAGRVSKRRVLWKLPFWGLILAFSVSSKFLFNYLIPFQFLIFVLCSYVLSKEMVKFRLPFRSFVTFILLLSLALTLCVFGRDNRWIVDAGAIFWAMANYFLFNAINFSLVGAYVRQGAEGRNS
jgi:hypothetical protein